MMNRKQQDLAAFRSVYENAKNKAFQFTSDFTKLTTKQLQWSADLFWWLFDLIKQKDFAASALRYFVNRGRQDGILTYSDWKYLAELI